MAEIDLHRLFQSLNQHHRVLLAVSGGPDSTALLLLARLWREELDDGPDLFAATVDHGLRRAAREEAEMVAHLSERLGIPHDILTWDGEHPTAGIQEAARNARYALLASHAGSIGATALVTAHTSDDQAETVLFRLIRGSGIAGLAGMAPERQIGAFTLLRPFLSLPKTALVATCEAAGVEAIRDPSNFDPRYARARLRAELLPSLAAEGLSADGLARFAARMRRADLALQRVTEDALEQICPQPWPEGAPLRVDRDVFLDLPEEIALRVLARLVEHVGDEGPAELGKLEALMRWITSRVGQSGPAGRTLAGALVRLERDSLMVAPAPARRFPLPTT
ncbi:tRNA lysidine(34) synthetase TilS [Ancylobacter sp. 6x-1]|uniref:tRNA(Ile)-lysidine synthase n=1 Tax=Ancylobacter crimeensis TaxID=2579147 RepID=A0ABT0DEE2_9HYPH|nr:tRNA lysidine(34) synthetase TilS [Ancylobacter crimeensis]MCK0198340.1 tRNA lysidine(34) synthetase TilS [Ancylobacter crimeensis]